MNKDLGYGFCEDCGSPLIALWDSYIETDKWGYPKHSETKKRAVSHLMCSGCMRTIPVQWGSIILEERNDKAQ